MARNKAPASPSPLDGLDAFAKVLDKALDVAEKNPDALEGMHEREGNPRPLAPRIAEVDDWAEKQEANAEAAGERWRTNMLRPKKDPIAEAKKASTKWANKLKEAIADNRFEKGLDAVDEAAMMETLEATPASVFVDGIKRRKRKIRGKIEKLRPLLVASAETLDKLPIDTEAQREAKMIANLRAMKEIGKRMKA